PALTILKYLKDSFRHFDLWGNITRSPYLLSGAIALIIITRFFIKLRLETRVVLLASTLLTSYLASHLIHMANYKENINSMKANSFFKETVIANGPAAFGYDDITSVYARSIFYAEKRGDDDDKKIR